MKFFSIIVPVYNRADRIGATVESIESQIERDFELILVDDGSTDRSLEVLQELANRDSRILVFSQTHSERGAARNYGARMASGRYLIFFDSDDLMYPQHLAKVRALVVASGQREVYYSDFETVDESGRRLCSCQVPQTRFGYQIYYNNFLGCDSVVIRADIFQRFQFHEDPGLAACEDKELWLRLAAVYEFNRIPECTMAMVEHPGRSLRNLSAPQVEQQTHLLIELLGRNREFTQRFRFHKFLFAYEWTAVSLAWSGQGFSARSLTYLGLAVRTSPLVIFSRRFLSAVKRCLYSFGKAATDPPLPNCSAHH